MSDEQRDEDGVHHPTGTMVIMSAYLLVLVAGWAWVFFIMASRS